MDAEADAPDDLHGALAAGATVVTATRRLARALRLAHAERQDATSWRTPDVLPWPGWVERSYTELRDYGALTAARPCLDDAQSTVLWERVVAAHPAGRRLLMAAGAISECRDAWRLMHEWELSRDDLARRASPDGLFWLDLAAAYQARLDAGGFVDAAQLPGLVTAHAGQLPVRLRLLGFDRLAPVQQRLLEAFGGRARHTQLAAAPGRVEAGDFPDPRAELEAAVAWARAQLENRPAARVAIVVPDLRAQAPILEPLLDEALAPERRLPGGGTRPRPWNLSLGGSLADTPPVAAALLALSMLEDELPLTAAGRLLRSPYFGAAREEAAARASLDAWLRDHAADRLPPARLVAAARRGGRAGPCPQLAAGLSRLLDVLWAAPRRRKPSAWAETFARALQAAGWPGEQALDSAGFQASGAWAELLASYARLDPVSGALAPREALALVRRLAAATLFQPETGEVPVQVLGLLETPGQRFDALWVTGLHDGVLPAPLRPSPLLPASLQRELGMPGACARTELSVARVVMARLAAAAPEVVFSWPRMREDEPLRPSPLLRAVPGLAAPPRPVAGIAARQFAARRLEFVADDRGPPLPPAAGGGTGLLRAQSACPFQAFARYRLGAEPLGMPAPGVDPMRRGLLLHAALKVIWDELRSRSSLAALDAAGRAACIGAALRTARAELGDLPDGLVELELAQAARQIEALLARELERPDFEVEQAEEWLPIAAGPLALHGKVDRVDRVPGGRAVIDYKTGEGSPGAWVMPRPREPQLPLYALNLPDVVAVAFACLKPGAVGFRGLARDPAALGPGGSRHGNDAAAEWTRLLAEWRAALDDLAGAAQAGDARVDPRDGQVCQMCDLSLLCRREALLRSGALEDV